MAINVFLDCPDNCDDDLLLPGIEQEQDCTNWLPHDSQVSDLFIFPVGSPLPSDWTDPLTWAGLINNLDETNGAGKWVVGEGGIQTTEIIVLDQPKKREKVTGRTLLLSFEVQNLTPNMYTFLRALQCGWTNFTFYYRTVGGRLFGSANGGISPAQVDVDLPLEDNRDEFETAVIGIQFETDATPDRTDSNLDDVLMQEHPWITPGGDPWVTPDDDSWIWSL